MAERVAGSEARTIRPVEAGPSGSGPLGVVDEELRLERARERRARLLVGLSGVVLALALVVVAVGHAVLAATQVRGDAVEQRLSLALGREQNLRWQKARLETPSRVLSKAESADHMVVPPAVTYLKPVLVGPSVLSAHERHAATSSHQRAK